MDPVLKSMAVTSGIHVSYYDLFYMLSSRFPDSLKNIKSEMIVINDKSEESAAAVP
jgi:hypothetical protein